MYQPFYSFNSCKNFFITPITRDDTPFESFNDAFKIVIILDESGSMQPVREEITKSINDLIREQKQVKDRPATLTLVKFNNNVRRVIRNKNLNDVNLLSYRDYNPEGSTALYDSIADTLQWMNKQKNVLVVIVTDGQENASKTYNKNAVTEMIEQRKLEDGWSFVYLSNDLSTFEQGNSIGLKRSAVVSNCVRGQESFGKFISKDLNYAIKECRYNGTSVQSQLR